MDAQGHVSPSEVRAALGTLYNADPESNLQKALLRSLADDLKPVNAKGRWRPNPLLILVAVLAWALMAVFLYFSVGAKR